MTLIELMKLADDYADKVARGKSGTQASRAALQSAIEALQAENEQYKDLLELSAKRNLALLAEQEALAAKLVPLTDEQIADLHRYAYTTGKAFTTIEVYTYFARAIEAAHGIQANGGQHG